MFVVPHAWREPGCCCLDGDNSPFAVLPGRPVIWHAVLQEAVPERGLSRVILRALALLHLFDAHLGRVELQRSRARTALTVTDAESSEIHRLVT